MWLRPRTLSDKMSNTSLQSRVLHFWKQYRYRFVPWLMLNLHNRSMREVPDTSLDKLIPDEEIVNTLSQLFEKFDKAVVHYINSPDILHGQNSDIMLDHLGYCVKKENSIILGGGKGVIVSDGTVPKGSVVSMYPGSFLDAYSPMFWVSLANPFIFRCLDGAYLNGNNRGLSRLMYTSASKKERLFTDNFDPTDTRAPSTLSDVSWMSDDPINPLAIGQYVNNQTKEYPANVAYQELELQESFPERLREYIPNNHAEMLSSIDPVNDIKIKKLTRIMVLVSLRKIEQGEELFSNYFTTVSKLDSLEATQDTIVGKLDSSEHTEKI